MVECRLLEKGAFVYRHRRRGSEPADKWESVPDRGDSLYQGPREQQEASRVVTGTRGSRALLARKE